MTSGGGDTGSGYVDGFVAQLRAKRLESPGSLAVLPPFHVNRLFQRYEVSPLGEDIARRLVEGLRSLADERPVVSPAAFELMLRRANRSLADVESPEDAVELAGRLGLRYLIRGLIEGSKDELSISIECVDVVERMVVAVGGGVAARGTESFAASLELFRDQYGHPLLGAYRIGALAPRYDPPLSTELQLILSSAVSTLLDGAGDKLCDLPVAVLPTGVPGEIEFSKYQRALRRAIDRRKEQLVASGLQEGVAMRHGPLRILGRTYSNLSEAEDYLSERQLSRVVSDSGKLGDTLSRMIFDITEDEGERAGVRVIPHGQLIDQAMLFSGEEVERAREGILPEEARKHLKTKGAGALLMSELLPSGDSYELVFQLRRLDTLDRLTRSIRRGLEPRFATSLGALMNENQ